MLPTLHVTGPDKGTALVFLHGFPFSHQQWEPQVRALAPTHRVVAYNQRGLGGTTPAPGPLTIEFLVDDLLAGLDHLGIERACLVGLSMGGYVALRAVDRHPERVHGLVLADTRAGGDDNAGRVKRADAIRAIQENGMKAFAAKMLPALFPAAALQADTPAVQAIRAQIEATDPLGACHALAAMAARLDLRERLGAIATPTLVLVGALDTITPPADARELAAGIPGATLVEVPGAGHVSNLDAPEVVTAALRAFLPRLEARAPRTR